MTKRKALVFLKEKLNEGYLTHFMMLEIYEEDEEVPEWFLNTCYHKPKLPKPIIMYSSIKNANMMDDIIKKNFKQQFEK